MDDEPTEIAVRFEKGCELHNAGYQCEAFEQFLWCAEHGDLESAYKLGWLYSHGVGTEVDVARSAHWYEKAAVEIPSAAYNLGQLHRRKARGLGPDSWLARRWFRRAGRLGKPDAWARYGEMYLGRGILGRNDARAFCLFRKGANSGSHDAAYRLGLAFEHGRGVASSVDEAVRWLKVAADGGHTRAARSLGFIMATESRFSIHEAVRWSMMAARRGDPPAQYNLGVLYTDGRGVKEDARKARRWFRRASKNGEASAQYNLAIMLADGMGGELDLAEAWFWMRLAEAGNTKGASDLLIEWKDRLTPDERCRVEDRVSSWLEQRKGRDGTTPA